MTHYTKRLQTLLTKEQHEVLLRLSEKLDKPVSALIREAIEQTYFAGAKRQQRQEALTSLLALNAPVADWEQMEDEIIEGAMCYRDPSTTRQEAKPSK